MTKPNQKQGRRRDRRSRKRIRTLPLPQQQRQRDDASAAAAAQQERVVFPDVLESVSSWSAAADHDNDDTDADAAVSEVFFALANAPQISYRVVLDDGGEDEHYYLDFRQDVSACGQHTGGIIWETSYLLLQYLSQVQPQKKKALGKTLELGAGVGFLGQSLAACGCCESVVLTETPEVLVNLQANLERNIAESNVLKKEKLSACALDWTSSETDIAAATTLQPHSIDTLLGTDVLFAPNLVEPLLATAERLSHSKTIWYLCVQIRCAQSHALFLAKAPDFGFVVESISDDVFATDSCQWGKTLECYIFRISRGSEDKLLGK